MSKFTSHVEEAGTWRQNRYWGWLRGYLGRLRRGGDQRLCRPERQWDVGLEWLGLGGTYDTGGLWIKNTLWYTSIRWKQRKKKEKATHPHHHHDHHLWFGEGACGSFPRSEQEKTHKTAIHWIHYAFIPKPLAPTLNQTFLDGVCFQGALNQEG